MGREVRNGVIYEGDPQNGYVVVGYEGAPAPIVIGTPNPQRQQQQQNDLALQQARLEAMRAELQAQQQSQPVRQDLLQAQLELARSNAANNANAQRSDQRGNNLRALRNQIDRVRELYQTNLRGGVPNGLVGVLPDLIRPENGQFNSAAAGLGEIGLAAFRVPGIGSQSDAELRQFVAANTPVATDSDSRIEEKLRNLENRLNSTTGNQPESANNPPVAIPGNQPNVLPIAAGAQGGGGGNGGVGVTPTGQGYAVNPALSGLGAEIAARIQQGQSPRDVIAAYSVRRQQAGFPPDPAQISAITAAVAAHRAQPNRPVNSVVQGFGNLDLAPTGQPNLVQAAIGNAADTTVGAGIIGAANGVSAGNLGNVTGNPELVQFSQSERPVSTLLGDAAGSAIALTGANRALGAAGGVLGRAASIGGGIVTDTGYGAVRGASETQGGVSDRLAGAALGAAGGAAGNLAGRYVAAPAATALLDTAAGRAVGDAFTGVGNRLGNAVRGARGLVPLPRDPFNPPAPLTPDQRIVANAFDPQAAADASAMLGQAADNGLPFTLADTSPAARRLAGAAFRRSGDAVRNGAETQLTARAFGQADRANAQIERNFGPIANPNEVSDQLLQQARTQARPLYDAFQAEPARTSPDLESILQTPPGREALTRAFRLAQSERRDPLAMGFDLNAQGEVMLTRTPSPQTLDYVKRGFDDTVNAYRDPTTGRVNLDDQGRAVEGLRRDFVSQMDTLYPNTYPQARAAYAGPAGEREALGMGRRAMGLQPRDIQRALSGLGPTQQEQYRLGARVAMSDRVNGARMTTNPYNAIHGSPTDQARIATLFPQGAPRFGQVANLETEMARTGTELLGGSPTAARQMADQQFGQGTLGQVGAGATDLLMGGAPMATAARIGLGAMLKQRAEFGMGREAQRRADAVLPTLLNPDPRAAQQQLDQLIADATARRVYTDRNRRRGGLIGASVATASPYYLGQ